MRQVLLHIEPPSAEEQTIAIQLNVRGTKRTVKEGNRVKSFIKAAGIRALRTVAQTAIATIGTSAILSDVNWGIVASASILAGILSLLTSVATGLPEAPRGGDS